MSKYFLHYLGQQHGPIDIESIRGLWKSAKLPANAQYWDDEAEEWRSILELASVSNHERLANPPAIPRETTAPSSGRAKRVRRPVVLTVLCLFGFFGAFATFIAGFAVDSEFLGAWYPPTLLLTGIAAGIAWFGVWNMRRWGVWLYIAVIVSGQVLLVLMNQWTVVSVLVPSVLVIILLFNIRNMT